MLDLHTAPHVAGTSDAYRWLPYPELCSVYRYSIVHQCVGSCRCFSRLSWHSLLFFRCFSGFAKFTNLLVAFFSVKVWPKVLELLVCFLNHSLGAQVIHATGLEVLWQRCSQCKTCTGTPVQSKQIQTLKVTPCTCEPFACACVVKPAVLYPKQSINKGHLKSPNDPNILVNLRNPSASGPGWHFPKFSAFNKGHGKKLHHPAAWK